MLTVRIKKVLKITRPVNDQEILFLEKETYFYCRRILAQK